MLTKPINNSEIKVKKEKGKGLSTNDFTNAYKEKLDNIATEVGNAKVKFIDKTTVASSSWTNDSTFADYPFKATVALKGITEKDWWCSLLTPNSKDDEFSKAVSPFVYVGDDSFSIYSKVKFDKGVIIENAVFETDLVNPPDVRPKYYGVRIDQSNSNPETCCTYLGDAVRYKAGDFTAWRKSEIFKDIKPCVLKNGEVQYYLNRDNLTLKDTGEPSNLDGTDGDVMVEVPRMGYKLVTAEDGNNLEVWVTTEENAEGYCYLAHSRDAVGDCDKIYYGAYLADSSMNSKVGITPAVSVSLGNFRQYAKNKGAGYEQFSFYPMTLMQCLYIIQYKNLNSQIALGQGWVSNSAKTSTGSTKTQKENYGTQSKSQQMKFLNLEDFWGNCFQYVDGIYSDSSYNILTDFQNFNDTGSGYKYKQATGFGSYTYGYMSKVQGTNNGGFVLKEKNGSTSTYFADDGDVDAGQVARFGGDWYVDAYAGAFQLYVNVSPSGSSYVSARLMFKHKEI